MALFCVLKKVMQTPLSPLFMNLNLGQSERGFKNAQRAISVQAGQL